MISIIYKCDCVMIKYSKVHASEVESLREASLNHTHHFIRRKALSQLLRQHDVNHTVIERVLGVCESAWLIRFIAESVERQALPVYVKITQSTYRR